MRTPSTFQTAILNAITNTKSNLIVDAVAGSGKTTTLEMACAALTEDQQSEAVFCAFSKAIQTELETRLPKRMTVRTIHAIGLAALRNAVNPRVRNWLDDSKYYYLCRDILDAKGYDGEESKTYLDSLKNAVMMAQVNLINPADAEEFDQMLMNYDIESFPGISGLVSEVMQRGVSEVKTRIAFVDMVWLPVQLNVAFQTYSFVFVDEVQDLSPVQREVISRMLRMDSRLIAVGDPKQAIFGFAGAGTDSFEQVKNHFGATQLPLSVCYRCPKSHVELAKTIVPNIESFEGAKEGTVADISYEELFNKVNSKTGDMILSRTNAPLVKIAFELIRRGVPAQIKGRDIMGQLVTLAKNAMKMQGASWDTFQDALDEYVQRQIMALARKKNSEMAIAALTDRADALSIIVQRAQALDQRISTINGLEKFIDRLYSNDVHGCVCLSSAHKAKGLEAENVFIYDISNFPHPMARQEWAVEQEYNLKYVALTRSKNALYRVAPEPKN